MLQPVAHTRYSLVKGERIVRYVSTTQLRALPRRILLFFCSQRLSPSFIHQRCGTIPFSCCPHYHPSTRSARNNHSPFGPSPFRSGPCNTSGPSSFSSTRPHANVGTWPTRARADTIGLSLSANEKVVPSRHFQSWNRSFSTVRFPLHLSALLRSRAHIYRAHPAISTARNRAPARNK
jgi:hypothetical protein